MYYLYINREVLYNDLVGTVPCMYQAHTSHIIFSAICKVYVYVINKLYICDNWQYVTGLKAESIANFREHQAFLRSYDLAPPHPLSPSRPQGVSLSQSSCVSLVELSDWIMGGGGLPYDGEKAWSSINHSILSCQKSTTLPPPTLGCPYPVSQYLHDVTFWAARFLVAVRGHKSTGRWGGGGIKSGRMGNIM
jgi:hypothetical protein